MCVSLTTCAVRVPGRAPRARLAPARAAARHRQARPRARRSLSLGRRAKRKRRAQDPTELSAAYILSVSTIVSRLLNLSVAVCARSA